MTWLSEIQHKGEHKEVGLRSSSYASLSEVVLQMQLFMKELLEQVHLKA